MDLFHTRNISNTKNDKSETKIKIKKDKNTFNKTFFINPIKKLQYFEKQPNVSLKKSNNLDKINHSKSLFRKHSDSSFNSSYSETESLNSLLKKLKSMNDRNLDALIKNIITIKNVFIKTFHVYRTLNCYNESRISLIMKGVKSKILVNYHEKLIDSSPNEYFSKYYTTNDSKSNLAKMLKEAIKINSNCKSIPKYKINSANFTYINQNYLSKQKLIVRRFEDAMIKKKINFQTKTKTFYWEEESSSFENIIKDESLINYNKINIIDTKTKEEDNNLINSSIDKPTNTIIFEDNIENNTMNPQNIESNLSNKNDCQSNLLDLNLNPFNINLNDLDNFEKLCYFIENSSKNEMINEVNEVKIEDNISDVKIIHNLYNQNENVNEKDNKFENNIILEERENELLDNKKTMQNNSISNSSLKEISIKTKKNDFNESQKHKNSNQFHCGNHGDSLKENHKKNEIEITTNNFKKIKVFQSKNSNVLMNRTTNDIKFKNEKLSERLKKPIFSVDFPIIIQKNIINSQYVKHNDIDKNQMSSKKIEIKKILNEKNVKRKVIKETSKYFLINSLNLTKSKLFKKEKQ